MVTNESPMPSAALAMMDIAEPTQSPVAGLKPSHICFYVTKRRSGKKNRSRILQPGMKYRSFGVKRVTSKSFARRGRMTPRTEGAIFEQCFVQFSD